MSAYIAWFKIQRTHTPGSRAALARGVWQSPWPQWVWAAPTLPDLWQLENQVCNETDREKQME